MRNFVKRWLKRVVVGLGILLLTGCIPEGDSSGYHIDHEMECRYGCRRVSGGYCECDDE